MHSRDEMIWLSLPYGLKLEGRPGGKGLFVIASKMMISFRTFNRLPCYKLRPFKRCIRVRLSAPSRFYVCVCARVRKAL